MSTTTLVSLGAPKLEGMDRSSSPTPNRGSLDVLEKDVEKLSDDQNEEDEPEQLSSLRTSLLIMGLTLSIFLVALDFVFLIPQ